jgi:hypothetical protein
MIMLTRLFDSKSAQFVANSEHNRALAEGLRVQIANAALGGGEKSRERHVSRGKLLLRDRVHSLLDPGSPFLELGALAANGMYGNDAPGAGVVAGIGRVSGRQVLIIANDPTVKGGAYFPTAVKKHLRAQEVALENRLPCVYLVDLVGFYSRAEHRAYRHSLRHLHGDFHDNHPRTRHDHYTRGRYNGGHYSRALLNGCPREGDWRFPIGAWHGDCGWVMQAARLTCRYSGSTMAHFCWSTATVLLLGTSGPRRRQAPSACDIARADLLLLALSDIAVGMAAVTSHIVLAHVSDRRAWLLMLHLQRGDQRVFRLDCYTCAFAVGVGPDHVSRRHGINSHDRQRFWGATVWRRASGGIINLTNVPRQLPSHGKTSSVSFPRASPRDTRTRACSNSVCGKSFAISNARVVARCRALISSRTHADLRHG